MYPETERVPSPSDIRTLRGERSRAAFGALVGVTGLTVYRWELPEGSPEARRPRGKVLQRLLTFIEEQRRHPASAPVSGDRADAPQPADDLAALAPAVAAMDGCQLHRAETELVGLLTSGTLRSEAARAYGSIMLARLQLLARHDTRSAFATLLGVAGDVERLPRPVQLEYHLTAAFLHAHSDAQLFNPGKTHHHATMAQPLLGEGRGDHRLFLWYTQFMAAVSLYEIALMARAMEGFAAVKDLATTPLHRCLAEEAATVSSLGLGSTAEAAQRVEQFRALAEKHGLAFQQVRALIWRAELLVEEAAPPDEILTLLDRADQLVQRHRIANGIHAMLMRRNRGETLLRLGRRREAEEVLGEATRVAQEISYTPIRISTALARIYLLTERGEDLARLSERSVAAEDAQKDLTRVFGEVISVMGDVHRGDASSDWCDRVIAQLGELRRLGVWPVAYRHLVLLTLGVAASRGGAGDAERLLQLAERAVEWSASPTASAVHRRHRATILIRRGHLTDARQALEAALATFEASGDLIEASLVRRALANVEHIEGTPTAEARLHETEAALRGLEIAVPPQVRADAAYEAPAPAPETPSVAQGWLERLAVPMQRLATRGTSEEFLQRELVNIVAELLPGRQVTLQEIDAAGVATTVAGPDETGDNALTWFEFSDGVGRRLRLGVANAGGSPVRPALTIVVAAAAMAFEIAALRGFTPRGRGEAAAAASEPVLADFVAASGPMRRLKNELVRLSGSRATIIVTGESGTGKEVIARAIHDLSRRAGKPYVTFNSAAVPRELFEGQLFGYRKGAFTGATSDHPGVIRGADGGTLFLDEIGELPLDVQPKLLRFLENAEVLPLGERKPVQVDVRIIAATHRDLLQLVREGKFREDLYYRLQVIPVNVPPLRERPEDVVALARHFVRKMTPAGMDAPVFTADGEARLLAHRWPGNVRELRNVIERCMAFDPLPRFIGAAEIRI